MRIPGVRTAVAVLFVASVVVPVQARAAQVIAFGGGVGDGWESLAFTVAVETPVTVRVRARDVLLPHQGGLALYYLSPTWVTISSTSAPPTRNGTSVSRSTPRPAPSP